MSLAVAGLMTLTGSFLLVGTAQAALPTLPVTINKTSITVGGAPQSGAVNVITTATGVKEADPVLFLLKPGVSVAEFNAFLATNKPSKDPNTANKFGTIVLDGEAAPGKPSEVQTTLQAGQYVAFNAAGEKSSKWTSSSFAVSEAPAPVALPAPSATIRTIDFGFRGPTKIHTGTVVRFENEGWLVHMDVAFPAKSKKAAKELLKGLSEGKESGVQKLVAGPPVNFAGPLSTGAYQQETVSAKPGYYVQTCFMTTQDGRPHPVLGMERIMQIVK